MSFLSDSRAERTIAGVVFPASVPTVMAEAIREVANSGGTIHLGIFCEPFLTLVLNGTKSIESRFSRTRAAPWHRITRGDLVLVAGVGTVVRGFFLVAGVEFFELTPTIVNELKRSYSLEICSIVDPLFWESKSDKAYATLVWLSSVTPVAPTKLTKRDRRGWVSFARTPDEQLW